MTAVGMRLRAELRARWRAWGAVALLIGIAGGAVLLTAAGARRTESAYSRYLRTSRASDLLVSVARRGLGGYYDAVARLPGIDRFALGAGLDNVDAHGGPGVGQIIGPLDGRYSHTVDRPKINAGRLPRVDDPHEAAADLIMARQLHLHVGSDYTFYVTKDQNPTAADIRRFDVRIVGILTTRTNAVSISSLDQVPNLMVTPALVRRLTPDYYGFDGMFVRLRPGVSVDRFSREAARLVSRYPSTGGQSFISTESDQVARIERAIRPQAVALAIFALLTALAVLFIVGQIVGRQLFLSTNDFPILRATGMTRAQLLVVALTEVGVTAAVGAVLAVGLAIVASPLALFGPAKTIEPHPGISADWVVLGIGAVAIVVLLLARTVWRAARLSTGGAPAREAHSSRVAQVAAQAAVPPSTTVGVRLALDPGGGQTAVPVRSALAGSVIAVTAVVAAFTFGANLSHLVDTPRQYGQTWDVIIDSQFSAATPAQLEALIKGQPGVRGWSYGDYASVNAGGRAIPGIGIARGRGPVMPPAIVDGRAPNSDDEVAFGATTLGLLHAHVGGRVRVTVANRTIAMRIVGRAVFPAFGQGSFTPTGLGEGALIADHLARTTDATRGPTGGNETHNFALVRIAPGSQHDSQAAALVRHVERSGECLAGQCATLTAQRPGDIKNFARVRSTPVVLAGLLALLALASIAHVLITSIRRRRRDLAVLKTLGFERRQVSASVAWQATTLVLIALAIGLPAGIVSGRFVWSQFATRLGVAPATQMPVTAVLIAIPVGLAVANLLALGPGWVAGRLRPAAVLRTE